MYDAKSEAHEFLGDTLREAIEKACAFFSREEGELTVKSLDGGRVSGLAERILIVAQPTEAVGRSASRGPREAEGRRAEREGGRRGRESGRRERESGRREREGGRREREGGRPEPELVVEGPSVGTVRGTIGPIGEFLLGTMERMGLGPFEMAESEEEDFLVYVIEGAAAQAMAGGEGRAPDALQLLANQAAARLSDEPKRVVVDVQGSGRRREEFLASMAERAARRARDTGRSVALDPMAARDRRAIHVALREAEGVATMSIGEGRYRQVVVVPEGAPEYEEAREKAERSGRED